MAASGFDGLTVGAFESRMAHETIRLIERAQGRPFVVPALREIPIQENPAAIQFGAQLVAEQVDVLILMTGVGTTALFDILQSRHPMPALMAGLQHTTLVARGAKAVAALKALGMTPTLTVPEPNTWVDVVATLDASRPVNGLRVAVQEYGAPNQELLAALRHRGAEVVAVPVYKWALPEDLGPLRQMVDRIIRGDVSVLIVTNAIQVDHVMRVVEQDGRIEPFRAALTLIVVASIGPMASERLRQHGWPVDLEPSHSKLGILIKEASERAPMLLRAKTGEILG